MFLPVFSFLGRPEAAHSSNFPKMGRKVESLNLYIIFMATEFTESSISVIDSIGKSSSGESVHCRRRSKALRKMEERMGEYFVTIDLGCVSIAILRTWRYSRRA